MLYTKSALNLHKNGVKKLEEYSSTHNADIHVGEITGTLNCVR